jgi:hypothetical protein
MDVAFSSDMQINGLFPSEADAVDLQNKSENAENQRLAHVLCA